MVADVVGYSRLTEGDEERSPISRGGEAEMSVTVTGFPKRPHLSKADLSGTIRTQ
jgi:hypothetical protein